ncbi:hypothetical protein [Carp edema virus]|nr:hypothetical protein [Carp edema virus]
MNEEKGHIFFEIIKYPLIQKDRKLLIEILELNYDISMVMLMRFRDAGIWDVQLCDCNINNMILGEVPTIEYSGKVIFKTIRRGDTFASERLATILNAMSSFNSYILIKVTGVNAFCSDLIEENLRKLYKKNDHEKIFMYHYLSISNWDEMNNSEELPIYDFIPSLDE